MDLMSILGWIFGIILIIFGIVFTMPTAGAALPFFSNDPAIAATINTSLLGSFFDVPSIAIVLGGTLCALMVSYPLKNFTKIGKHMKIIMFPTKYNPHLYISQIVEFAKEARINGLLALEDKLNETEDMFLKNSLMLVIDSVEAEKVKTLLETELDYLEERHSQDRAFYAKGSVYAPAFGMIGTLIGLINLLKNLDDANKIAPAMAVALVTTFYGSVLSNLLFAPIANKLKVRHDEEYLCKMIISEGVQAIQAGDNPKFIEEKLTQLLPISIAAKSAKMEGDDGKKAKKAKPAKAKK